MKTIPAQILLAISPEEAMEITEALKAKRNLQVSSVLKPPAPPPITVGKLQDALTSVGITTAHLLTDGLNGPVPLSSLR